LGDGLAGLDLIAPPPPGAESTCHLYVVRARNRDQLRDRLRQRGVQSEVHYPTPDYRQPGTRQRVSLPATEAHCRTVLSLPCYPELTEAEVDATIAAVRAVLARRRARS
jgi:dTDP-4-amino-4,6-dideoxygalactose transaminase